MPKIFYPYEKKFFTPSLYDLLNPIHAIRDQENTKLPVINYYIHNYIDIATIKNGILENTKSLT